MDRSINFPRHYGGGLTSMKETDMPASIAPAPLTRVKAEMLTKDGRLEAKFVVTDDHTLEALNRIAKGRPGKVVFEQEDGSRVVYKVPADSLLQPSAPLPPGAYDAVVTDVSCNPSGGLVQSLQAEGRTFEVVTNPVGEAARVAQTCYRNWSSVLGEDFDSRLPMKLDPSLHGSWDLCATAYGPGRTEIAISVLRAARMEYPGLSWEIAVPIWSPSRRDFKHLFLKLVNVDPGKQSDRYRLEIRCLGAEVPFMVNDVSADGINLEGFHGDLLEALEYLGWTEELEVL